MQTAAANDNRAVTFTTLGGVNGTRVLAHLNLHTTRRRKMGCCWSLAEQRRGRQETVTQEARCVLLYNVGTRVHQSGVRRALAGEKNVHAWLVCDYASASEGAEPVTTPDGQPLGGPWQRVSYRPGEGFLCEGRPLLSAARVWLLPSGAWATGVTFGAMH